MQEISKSKISRYAKLSHKKHRLKDGLFIAEGLKTVTDTMEAFIPEAFIITDEKLAELIPDRYSGLTFLSSQQDISKISGLATASDILAVYKLPEHNATLEEPDESQFNLVLDGVQDPGNLGTIIRTAHWFGIRKIFCSKDTVDLYNPKTVQATMGSIAEVIVNYVELDQLFEKYPDLPRYGLLLEGESIFSFQDFKKGFIIMGNEGKGISKKIRDLINRPLTIPPADPQNHPDSLNVAIATAVTLSQMVK